MNEQELDKVLGNIPYRARYRLEPDGPVYVLRFQGDRAVFTRKREDGTIEVVVRPRHTEAYPVVEIDPEGPFTDLLRPPEP